MHYIPNIVKSPLTLPLTQYANTNSNSVFITPHTTVCFVGSRHTPLVLITNHVATQQIPATVQNIEHITHVEGLKVLRCILKDMIVSSVQGFSPMLTVTSLT